MFDMHESCRQATYSIRDVWAGVIDPGRVFDLTLPLSDVAQAYTAMDERRSIKPLLRP